MTTPFLQQINETGKSVMADIEYCLAFRIYVSFRKGQDWASV